MSYHDGDDWLDGIELARWLDREIARRQLELNAAGFQSLQRRLQDWRHGRPANVYTIDHYLCRLGYCFDDLPDKAWLCPQPSRVKGGLTFA